MIKKINRISVVIKNLKDVCLFIFIFHSFVYPANIVGVVKSKSDQKPYNLANLSLSNNNFNKVVSVDGRGRFTFDGIPAGKYVLKTNALGLVSRIDSISIKDSSKTYDLEIILSEAIIESNPETEKYHLQLLNENKKNPILTLTIEHFNFKNGIVTIYPSVRNNIDISFTLVRVFGCINYFSAVVRDGNGKVVDPNSHRIDCVGEKIYPTRDDLIIIPEEQTIDCPPVKLENYNFNLIPDGVYTLELVYKYEMPKYLCCESFRPDYRQQYEDVISTLITTLRGEYISSNKIKFENKH